MTMTDPYRLEQLRTQAALEHQLEFIAQRRRRRFQHAVRTLYRLSLETLIGIPQAPRFS